MKAASRTRTDEAATLATQTSGLLNVHGIPMPMCASHYHQIRENLHELTLHAFPAAHMTADMSTITICQDTEVHEYLP